MGDQQGGRGRGRGQGRGRGRGGRGGQAQTIKNLERAANDIQNMLQKMTTSDDQDMGGSMGGNRRKQGTRGCKSMMDLNVDTSPQWKGPPRQDHGYQRPSSQASYHHGPPHQDSNYPGPPNHGPGYHGPPGQGYHGPPGQGYHGPPGQGYHGPPGQGYHGPPGQGYHGPPGQGYHGPPGQGPYPGGQYPPPPSYDESVAQYSGRQQSPAPQKKPKGGGKASQQGKGKSLTAEELVKALALFEGQMADTQMISRQTESRIEDVEEVVKQRKDIFAHMKDGSKTVVELVPNIKLCQYYLSENGCTARDTCKALHLCKSFIVARCDKGPSCPFGHKLDTNHNAAILSKMYLDLIKTNNLLSVIRKVCRGNAPPKICSFYETKAGCRKKDDCHFLHICKDYVKNGGKCSVKGCSFNHQLTTKQCRNVLTQHGISTNESIRDIFMKLNLSNESSGRPGEATKDKKKAESDDSEDSSDSDTSRTSEASVRRKKKRSRSRDKTKGRNPTIRSTDFHGDVEVPEICIYAVSNKCTNEKKGCKYLHAKSLFHWQVEKANKWYNLRIFQSKALESAYRDVSKGGTKLPSIDANKLSPEDKGILGLLGTYTWTANFKDMCITDPANNRLNIRRVSTPSSALSSLPQATVYEWYFTDEQGKWIRYGHVDSLGKQDLVCNMTSEDIEKQYVADSSATMIISNNRYKYKIDFKNMTQTNLSSLKVREIRRRPSRLSYQKGGTGSSASESDSSLPAHWKPMAPNQTHILVPLDSSQAEYQEVSKSIKLMIPTAKICEIRRLQNEYLWRLFQYKKADLSRHYDDDAMNVQKLFHGTTSDSISPICKENIDGRRYVNTKDKYGRGTYFSNSPAIARNYCTPDGQGHLFLVLTEVIIGYVTVGNKSMNRPPPNPTTGHTYDTTVDSVTAPTVFVKYDKEEYYPEYIVEISA